MLPSPLWSSGHLSRTPRAHLCAEAQQQQPRNHAELPALMSKHLPWVAGVAGAATVPRPLASAHTGPRDCRELSHLGYGQDMVTCVGPQGHSCLHLGILFSQVWGLHGGAERNSTLKGGAAWLGLALLTVPTLALRYLTVRGDLGLLPGPAVHRELTSPWPRRKPSGWGRFHPARSGCGGCGSTE